MMEKKEQTRKYIKFKQYRCYQKWIARGSALAGLCWMICFSWLFMKEAVPDKIWIIQGREESFDFHVPVTGVVKDEGLEVFGNQSPNVDTENMHVDFNEGFSLKSQQQGDYSISCKLFGLINLKEVSVQVVDEEMVAPCGVPIGIYVKTDGVLIIGTGAVTGSDGMSYEPAANLVKSGDYIKTVNEQVIQTKEDLVEKVNESQGESVVLGIMRNDEYIKVKVEPVKTLSEGTKQTGEASQSEAAEYKLGIWVRDDLAGVGTLTYYTKEGEYGALGHPVSDMDTGVKVSMSEGTLYEAEIAGITKGEKGKPGELSGVITYLDQYKLGTVQENTDEGIYGRLERTPDELTDVTYYPIGLKQEIQEGEAVIISDVSGERKEYKINITGLDYNSGNKGISFQVTDPELLELTGGIVQGMSGSPIIQNGKVIGAVTHVFVQDASKGYGIFIEHMLQH